ncbi:hypothetical protein [Pyxidicoccus caerfyrddinensis]|uniref:hypothetical protein n=1 Tax=Pyxidicoccus caerfyrddinensis TaxID=2709663 RepID=UPI0013DBA7B7|nr:hypothetical protein [Pyxidicoccus caerfyrddinensis]
MQIWDDASRVRLYLGLSATGEPSLLLRGSELVADAFLKVTDEDVPMLGLTRGRGQPAVSVKNSAQWAGIMAMGKDGKSEADLYVLSDGTPLVNLKTPRGSTREVRAQGE